MHRALTKINSVTVDTETDPGLGCATSARLPNMWPVAGNPVVRAPQGNYGNGEVQPCPDQDSNPRSTLTFVRARCINHCAIKAFCTCGTITGSGALKECHKLVKIKIKSKKSSTIIFDSVSQNIVNSPLAMFIIPYDSYGTLVTDNVASYSFHTRMYYKDT